MLGLRSWHPLVTTGCTTWFLSFLRWLIRNSLKPQTSLATTTPLTCQVTNTTSKWVIHWSFKGAFFPSLSFKNVNQGLKLKHSGLVKFIGNFLGYIYLVKWAFKELIKHQKRNWLDDCCFRKLKVVKRPYSTGEVSTPTLDLTILSELIGSWPYFELFNE